MKLRPEDLKYMDTAEQYKRALMDSAETTKLGLSNRLAANLIVDMEDMKKSKRKELRDVGNSGMFFSLRLTERRKILNRYARQYADMAGTSMGEAYGRLERIFTETADHTKMFQELK